MTQDDKVQVLVNKHWHKTGWEEKHNTFMPALGWLAMVPLIVLSLYPLYLKADKSWDRVPALLLCVIKAHPENVLMLAAIPCFLFCLPVYQKHASKTERRILSNEGISYTSPLPGLLKRFKSDWTLAWSQVSKIEIFMPHSLVRNPALIGLMPDGRSYQAQDYTDPLGQSGNPAPSRT